MTRKNTLLLALSAVLMAAISSGALAQVTVPSIPLPAGVTSGNPIETGVSLGKLIAGYILVGIRAMGFIFSSYGAIVDIIAWYNGKKTGGEVFGKALGMTVIAVFAALIAIFALTNIVNIGGAGTP